MPASRRRSASRNPKRRAALLAGVVVMTGWLAGCSAVGYGTGALLDERLPGGQVENWRSSGARLAGPHLRVERRDGSVVRGQLATGGAGPESTLVLSTHRSTSSFAGSADSGVVRVPYRDVLAVSEPGKRYRILGLVLGMAVDAFVVLPAITGRGVLLTVPD